MKTPITLLVDDPCPIVHVFRDHWVDVHHKPVTTADGRELHETIPNAFLNRFCDVMERRGIRGKFSIVPSPSGKGDVVRGISGRPEETIEWLETAKARLGPICDFCPEMTTHNLALDLSTGGFFPQGESEWSQTQDRTTLLPYISHALSLLKEAGIECTGVTSPWVFGQSVLLEYEWSIVQAFRNVYGREPSWYFLHMLWDRPGMRPWVANGSVPPEPSPAAPSPFSLREKGEGVLIAIPATVRDWWWATIDSPRNDAAWIDEIASKMLSADGQSGEIVTVLEGGGWPVVLTHWQSLFSNGVESGLAVLDLLGKRIQDHLSDRVEWVTCSEMADRTRSAS
jgi:hypothetical protein